MNKELDELVSQADQQLQSIETEYLEKEAAHGVGEEVSHETAVAFNRAASGKNSSGVTHAGRALFGALVFSLLLAGHIYLWTSAPRATGPYHVVTGIVQSSAIIWSSRMYYGSVAASKVKLPNGQVISIRLVTVRLLPAGTPVALRVYDTGAVRADKEL